MPPARSTSENEDSRRQRRPLSLRNRVTLLAASSVGFVVALMALAAYFVVASALHDEADNRLRAQADQLVNSQMASEFAIQSRATLVALRAFNPDLDAQIIAPSGTRTATGETFQVGAAELRVVRGDTESSMRSSEGKRIYATRVRDGSTLILAQDLSSTREILRSLAIVLGIVGVFGIALAAMAGTAVGRTGLAPVGRLTRAVERVAETDDLRPIPVAGDDEIARLTRRFNQMLHSLEESRARQSQLVADAGHELKTPLTSLRTNLELVIAASRPGARGIPDEDREELERDVIDQLEELSQLVGDLVDLAREDSGRAVEEHVDVDDVVTRSLERVRRRAKTVEFDVQMAPWHLVGDPPGLERAVLNLLDNAVKWSPDEGVVGVRLEPVSADMCEFTVSDSGPGIPEEERELVFERFYRSTESRSMPGSGLGLAIVRQVFDKHGGSITAEENPGGGTIMRGFLSGSSSPPADS